MIARQFKLTRFDWNYKLYAQSVRFVGGIGIVCQLLLYLLLPEQEANAGRLAAHLVVVLSYVPFAFLACPVAYAFLSCWQVAVLF